MRRVALLLIAMSAAAPMPRLRAQAPPAADSAAILGAARDYIEGWYAGDASRMERAVHPKLAKRIIMPATTTAPSRLVETTALELVEQTRRGGGRDIPPAARRTEARILDAYENAASVRVDAGEWIDYLHLVRADGRWAILNVLWVLRPEARR
jgi:hypothetical protein